MTTSGAVVPICAQVLLLDIVFSLDSVITAIGMVEQIEIMIAAVIVAIAFMMFFAGPVGRFVQRHPTVKMLALSFLLLIGLTLLVATWRGRPKLMGLVTVIVLISTLATWAAPSAQRLEDFRIADGSYSYTTAAELPAEITGSAGDLQLDFSRLALASDQTVEISLGAGDVTITLPEGVNSEVTWDVGIGEVVLPDATEHGGTSLTGTTTNVVDAKAATLRLTVALRVGSLEVTK